MSMPHDASASPKGRPLTGRMVLAMLLAFFGVVIGVNLVMVRLASSTFSGLGDKNAYVAGLSHNRTLAAARAQEQRGWKVDASVRRIAPGRSRLSVIRADAAAGATLEVVARFEHPASSTLDRAAPLVQSGAGIWSAAVDLPAGGWDLIIEMRSGGTLVFLSRDRIQVSDAKIESDG
ncbi:MAG: FixH family protein [Beijerinckiaceae bacterium]|nr:FixH family protein [Beijerinckiaceae bacterium]